MASPPRNCSGVVPRRESNHGDSATAKARSSPSLYRPSLAMTDAAMACASRAASRSSVPVDEVPLPSSARTAVTSSTNWRTGSAKTLAPLLIVRSARREGVREPGHGGGEELVGDLQLRGVPAVVDHLEAPVGPARGERASRGRRDQPVSVAVDDQ